MSKQQFALSPASIRKTVPIELDGYGSAEFSVFDGLADGRTDNVSITFRRSYAKLPLVRTHYECLTGDVFRSCRCDCGPQLEEALRRCSREGGTILYLRQEGRGIGLASKIEAYALQDDGLDTFAANRALGFADDARDFRVAAQMLEALGLRTIRLLTNNPNKVAQLERFGITVACCETTLVSLSPHNRRYLAAKRDHAGHRLVIDDPNQI